MRRFYLLIVLLITACSNPLTTRIEVTMTPDSAFSLTSSAFREGGSIPPRYSCKGKDVSPDLVWSEPPEGTASLALTLTDPDARGFVHWVVWNIPAAATGFTEGAVPEGAIQGRNSFRRDGWGGPCPPSGSHHYVFTLYALDTTIDLPAGSSLIALQETMSGHVLAQAKLTGLFP